MNDQSVTETKQSVTRESVTGSRARALLRRDVTVVTRDKNQRDNAARRDSDSAPASLRTVTVTPLIAAGSGPYILPPDHPLADCHDLAQADQKRRDIAALIATAARSVMAEHEAGRSVDPRRLEWARGELRMYAAASGRQA